MSLYNKREVVWFDTSEKEEATRVKYGSSAGCTAIGFPRNCERCGKYDLMAGVCIECLDELRAYHEQFESIWDIEAEDAEIFGDPEMQVQFVMLSMISGGQETAIEYYGVEESSMDCFLRNYRKGLAKKRPAELELRKRVMERIRAGDVPDAVREEVEEMHRTTKMTNLSAYRSMKRRALEMETQGVGA